MFKVVAIKNKAGTILYSEVVSGERLDLLTEEQLKGLAVNKILEEAAAGNYKVNLDGADLSGVHMVVEATPKVSFKEADFSAATIKANLEDVDFTGALFHRADLSFSNLKGADFSGADLTKAFIKGADLEGAKLTGADFEGAELKGIDLSKAKELTATQLLKTKTLYGVEVSDIKLMNDFNAAVKTIENPPFTAGVVGLKLKI